MRLGLHTLLFVFIVFFASCEKSDTPVILPPKGSAIPATITMGESYESEVYFDFETGLAVKTSPIILWDLSFEAGADGCHVFVNGGKDMFVYNTHTTDASVVNTAAGIATNQFVADAPCGLPDSTAIGEWRDASGNSKNLVYILKFPDKVYRKISIVSVDATHYVLAYGEINAVDMQTITIPKNSLYSRSYFSFDNGGAVVQPEPPKEDWDIVFTRYHYVYTYLNNTPYLVSGVLLNPYNTVGLADSTTGFNAIEYNAALLSADFTNARDVIGFDWKAYNFTSAHYEVHPEKCYVVKNRTGAYYKLHFLDFYDAQGIKGTPSFEYSRIQ